MSEKTSPILEFLAVRPLTTDQKIIAAREEIEGLVSALKHHPQPRFDRLAAYRLLASSTLIKKVEERKKWDLANQMLADSLEKKRDVDLSLITELNGLLRGATAQLRDSPVYGCGETYLDPKDIAAAIGILNETILTEGDPLLKAARIYIWVITAHPFLDANGRTARLAADAVLLAAGYLPLCFHSTVQSHVGQTQECSRRTPEQCLLKCLRAIIHAYHLVLDRIEPMPSHSA